LRRSYVRSRLIWLGKQLLSQTDQQEIRTISAEELNV
jgi:hypothetical protein